ncbi:outer membrane receptor protein involved in Fe transport [Sphingobium xanthum]|uniref:TonB-dependent receptor n=1 Tax=Sphingobium xanthum TaxID=1387165 RepID=UPI001C8BCEAB|nr:TonB-dependent receptor [Sphingobium xanthum]
MAIRKRFGALLLGVAAIEFMAAAPGTAQVSAKQTYDLEAQDLGSALRAVGRVSGRQIIFQTDELTGATAPRLKGIYTADEAIGRILGESGLTASFSPDAVIIRGRSSKPGPPASASVDGQPEDADAILITGSRIRGAPVASPVIVQTQQQMRDAGQNSLADAIRAIPQNFNGGQNPGVGLNVPESNGVYTGSGAGLNLRGLGSDATLTLLNGHRLPYNVYGQAIDISAVPLSAVERVEIVADGASALYGSDAIAGVANVILKRDFEGLSTGARFGASTDGGNQQQQYSVVGGKTWTKGGFLLAYDFERDTPILARQRSYAAEVSRGLTLFPALKRHNVLLSGHQEITTNLTFAIDGLYNKRWSSRFYALNAAGDYWASGGGSRYSSESLAVAPSLTLTLPGSWTAELSSMYGEDKSNYATHRSTAGVETIASEGCYCNKAQSVELGFDGPLFHLTGGDAKIAFGGGFRSNDFHGYRTRGSAQNIKVSQDTYYAYGELNLPFVSPGQATPLIHRLSLSAALRYEDYAQIDRVATPKIGLIYSPSADVDVKGSWGKSFKAPTLYQLYNVQTAQLQTVASVGGTGYPTTATALGLFGGNPALKPERATTWAATLVVRPRILGHARLEISYFNIEYRDRVVTPITFLAQALSDPINRDLVKLAPSEAEKASLIAEADTFFNATSRAYNPADVVAIFNRINLNAARQTVSGVDVTFEYEHSLGSYGSLTATGNGSYLKSSQQLSNLQPVTERTGTLFNPPKFRARAGLSWDQERLTVTSFVNHIGSVSDLRTGSGIKLGSMTTVDLTARVRISQGPAIFRNTDIILSAQNLFNDKPSYLRVTQFYDPPYDSTNYSPIGRFVSFGITKQW